MKRLLLIFFTVIFLIQFAEAQSLRGNGPILRSYPNPAVSRVTFDFQKAPEAGYSIQVFSFLGKKVFEQKNMAQRTTINLNDYNRGVYVYQLRDRSGRMVESGKFQVSR